MESGYDNRRDRAAAGARGHPDDRAGGAPVGGPAARALRPGGPSGGYNLRRRQLEKKGFDIKAKLLKRRGELLVEVHDATNAAGKPLYSNAEQRAAAITQRCDEDADFKTLEAERHRLQEEYDQLATEYSVMGDNFDISWRRAASRGR